jgi:hypothetical protein
MTITHATARWTLALAAGIVLAGASARTQPGAQPAAKPAGPRPPAATLAPAGRAASAPGPDGFIRRWLVLEPLPVDGQLTQSAVTAIVRQPPFADAITAVPRDGETLTVGDRALAWHALDTTKYNLNLYHFAYALGKPTSNVLFWAVTVVNSPRDMPDVRLAIGSNAASVWWLNGQETVSLFNDRQTVIDDGVSRRLTLRKGPNVLRAAIVNRGGATDFCARFVDDEGRPIAAITIDLGAAPGKDAKK